MEMIQHTTFDDSDRMVSFDVTSLFTKVPLDEAMEAIAGKLTQDDTLEERTMLSPVEICHLTNLSMYFQFKDDFL